MQVVINVPEQYLLDLSVGEFAKRLKRYTALLMFQVGQLSAGAACEFAEIDRYMFLEACNRHNITVIDYDEGELEAEFEQFNLIHYPLNKEM